MSGGLVKWGVIDEFILVCLSMDDWILELLI